MNRTKIEWCDYTWNPITGCFGGCFYCYARKIYERFHKSFIPEIHYDRLSQPLKCKEPSKIFVCSVSDFWGMGVKPIWREEVYNTIKATPEHTYLILTKQPQNIKDWDRIPENVWLGVSVTGESDHHKIDEINNYEGIKFVSFEPLLDRPIRNYSKMNWVIIGTMTGTLGKNHKPATVWIQDLLQDCRRLKIPVFIKDNVGWGEKIQEFPNAWRIGE